MYYLIFGVSPYNDNGKLNSFIVKKIFIGTRFNVFPVTCVFKGHAKIVKVYLVKFNVTTLNSLEVMRFSNEKTYK